MSAAPSSKEGSSFWRGRRVLLTGHTGFKGSWLATWLLSQGASVTGLALPPETQPNVFDAAGLADRMDSHFVDIRTFDPVAAVVRQAEPEIVFHLAAQPLVRRSYQDPIHTYAVNVMGTVHVLEAARAAPSVRVIVVVTSDKCYENQNWPWPYREYEPMGGHDPYSSSKGCAELVTAAWRRSFFQAARDSQVAVASVRAGNVIGGGDWAQDRLVPDCIRAFEADRPVLIRNPHAVRPWQHVLEPLRGYMLLAEAMWKHGQDFAEAWNFGPSSEDARPVGWIVERMIRAWGGNARWERIGGEHPHEAAHLQIDSAKSRARLDWKPRLTLEDALGWIVDWHRRLAAEGARKLMLEQIARYESAFAAKRAD